MLVVLGEEDVVAGGPLARRRLRLRRLVVHALCVRTPDLHGQLLAQLDIRVLKLINAGGLSVKLLNLELVLLDLGLDVFKVPLAHACVTTGVQRRGARPLLRVGLGLTARP